MSIANVMDEMKNAPGLEAATTVPTHVIRGAFSVGIGSYFSISTYSAHTDTNTWFPGAIVIDVTNGRVAVNSASSITAAAVFTSVYS